MAIVNGTSLESNKNLKFNFDGGNLSSDAGMILIKEFAHKLGVQQLVKESFKTKDSAIRIHTDSENLMQMVYQIIAAYNTDDMADSLKDDPVFTSILGKDTLASQPTLSRFHNRMDESTLEQLESIIKALRKRVYSVKKPEYIIADIDSTLLDTYGNQEGAAFNYHYQANGYHPLVCYDGLTGDLLKIELRNGTEYCCNGAADFLKPLLQEYSDEYPEIAVFLRGDSGFATDEMYSLCESNGTSYVIRLKDNPVLRRLASPIEDELSEKVADNMLDYAVSYGEFQYKAKTWNYPRRVVCKVEKSYGQMLFMYTFIVTNMDSDPERVLGFYCKRGTMENFIKESKNGFDFCCVSSATKIVNANRLMIHALAYNIFNWLRRLVLPVKLMKDRIDTYRLKLIKIAAKIVRTSRYVVFKLCSSCPYKDDFYNILSNIVDFNPIIV